MRRVLSKHSRGSAYFIRNDKITVVYYCWIKIEYVHTSVCYCYFKTEQWNLVLKASFIEKCVRWTYFTVILHKLVTKINIVNILEITFLRIALPVLKLFRVHKFFDTVFILIFILKHSEQLQEKWAHVIADIIKINI